MNLDIPYTITANCKVHYKGRTESTSDVGIRLILKKSDNSMQIHNGVNIPPLNYNRFTYSTYENNILTYYGKELIKVEIHELLNYQPIPEWSNSKITIKGSEKDYKNHILANLKTIFSFNIINVINEYKMGAGKVDLCIIENTGLRHVIEIKRKKISLNNIFQLHKYTMGSDNYKAYIAGPDICQKAMEKAKEFNFEYLNITLKN